MSALTVLIQMLILFAMMFVGYVIAQRGILTESASAQLSKLVVSVLNPFLMLSTVLNGGKIGSGEELRQTLILTCLYFGLMLLAGLLAVLIMRPEKKHRCLVILMMLFSNMGFMGIPVIRGIFGDGAASTVTSYIVAFNILFYTFGYYLVDKAGEANQSNAAVPRVSSRMKRMLNPGFIGALISFAILVSGIHLPAAVGTFANYMGNATVPLSMLLIGANVFREGLLRILTDRKMYLFVLLKMLVFPVLIILILKQAGFHGMPFGVFAIELGMPVANVTVMAASESGADAAYCTKAIILTTLVSVVTVPLIGALL